MLSQEKTSGQIYQNYDTKHLRQVVEVDPIKIAPTSEIIGT